MRSLLLKYYDISYPNFISFTNYFHIIQCWIYVMYDTLQIWYQFETFHENKISVPYIAYKLLLGQKIIHFGILNAKKFLTTIEINDIITSDAFCISYENCNYDFNMLNKNIAQQSTFLHFHLINKFAYALYHFIIVHLHIEHQNSRY